MGSAEETTPSSKPPNPKTTTTTTTTTPPTPPPPATFQEAVSLPATPSYSTDWAAAVQAYYSGAAATPPPFFSPAVWGSQHLISPYGTPIPYSPVYHHPMYAHPSMATAVAYPAAESGSNKSKGGSGKSGDGGKVSSGSADEYASQSGGESGSEGTSGTRDDSAEPQDLSKKRSFSDAFAEGENSQPITAAQNNGTTAESPYSGRVRTVSKLPVSAPGRATLPGPPTNLNIGMDLWNASHAGTVPVKGRPSSMSIAPATVGANGVMPEHQLIQDERELKRERRKQSNRESARRSRLRKQQECEDLARTVTELNSENSALKIELEQLNKVCKDLEAENASITEELNRMAKTGVVSELEVINCNSASTMPSAGSGGSGHVPQNPVGSNGKIYKPSSNFESVSR